MKKKHKVHKKYGDDYQVFLTQKSTHKLHFYYTFYFASVINIYNSQDMGPIS